MKVLVTGGTDDLGIAVVEKLKKKKHKVVVLTKSEAEHKFKTIDGEVTDFDELKKAAKGVDAIVHLDVEDDVLKSWDDQYKLTVEGVENIFKVAKKLKIKKIVLLSSIAAKAKNHVNLVKAIKLAEEIVEDNWDKINVSVIRASQMYDKEFIDEVEELSKVLIPKKDSKFHPVYKEVLVDSLVAALKKGKSRVYHIGDTVSIPFYKFVEAVSYPKKPLFLPAFISRLLSNVSRLSKFAFEDQVFQNESEDLGVEAVNTIETVFKIRFGKKWRDYYSKFKK